MSSNSTPNAALQHSMQLLHKARQAEAAGNKALALKAYQAAIQTCPANGASYGPYIQFLMSVSAYAAVIPVCKALPKALYQSDVNIRFSHAIALIAEGEAEQGIELLEAMRQESGINLGLIERNIGSARQRLQDYTRAREHYARAIEHGQNSAEMQLEIARTFVKEARFSDAEASFQAALAAAPENPDIRYERALMLLQQGEYAQGFAEYTQRWPSALYAQKKYRIDVPEWQPDEPCQRLLVLAEQGIGDQILFGRFLAWAMARAEQVTFACDPRLKAMFERSLPGLRCIDLAEAKAHANGGHADRIIYLGDLAGYPDNIDINTPYLAPDDRQRQALHDEYRQRFAGKQRVGLSWRSARQVYGDFKSIPLAAFSHIIEHPQRQCISVQYGDISADLATLTDATRAALWQDDRIDAFDDLDGLAAQLCALDVLVTTSNSTAHLAAALGVTTLLLLPRGAGLLWYWGHAGNRVDWYPDIVALRANAPGDWHAVLEQVSERLADAL